MIVKKPELERALDAGGAHHRLILLYGPDEAGSRALADRLGNALGAGAERIDLTGATLKADPARLADEAGAISLFGDRRYVRIEPAGDEICDAVVALAERAAEGNPVVAVAGALRKDAKLLKLVSADPSMIAFASYVPEGADAERLAGMLAREAGLIITPDIARRLASAASGDRAILAREIEKLALFVDASPERPREIEHEALDALGAAVQEGDMSRLVDAVLDGRLPAIQVALVQLSADGLTGVPLVRALLRRMLQLAEMRGGHEAGAAMASSSKSLFWKEKQAVERQSARWRPEAIERAVTRLTAIERGIKASGSLGPLLLDEELFAIGRAAQRMH